jgi:D-alanine-D-alanine ligase
MRVGLIYDVYDDYPWREGEAPDADAEFEPEETVESLAEAVRMLGHEPVRIGTAFDLLERLKSNGADGIGVDIAINIAEAAHSRNREAYAPILLEMAGIPFLGSDALTLSVSLDKAWTKDLAHFAGVPTPAYSVFGSSKEVTHLPGEYPLFVKARYEGSSKGILTSSRVDSHEELLAEIDRVAELYDQEVIVETFIDGGGEFTVAVVGTDEPRALPVLQRAVERETRIGLHALDRRGVAEHDYAYDIDGELTPELESELQRLSVAVFKKLACRDFARVDFRVDADGKPWFLEINPLPTFAPDGTFAIAAELAGMTYPAFLADVLGEAIDRALREAAAARPPRK